jgi:hypothetical protein
VSEANSADGLTNAPTLHDDGLGLFTERGEPRSDELAVAELGVSSSRMAGRESKTSRMNNRANVKSLNSRARE